MEMHHLVVTEQPVRRFGSTVEEIERLAARNGSLDGDEIVLLPRRERHILPVIR